MNYQFAATIDISSQLTTTLIFSGIISPHLLIIWPDPVIGAISLLFLLIRAHLQPTPFSNHHCLYPTMLWPSHAPFSTDFWCCFTITTLPMFHDVTPPSTPFLLSHHYLHFFFDITLNATASFLISKQHRHHLSRPRIDITALSLISIAPPSWYLQHYLSLNCSWVVLFELIVLSLFFVWKMEKKETIETKASMKNTMTTWILGSLVIRFIHVCQNPA